MITDKTSFEFFDWLLQYNRYQEMKNNYIKEYVENGGQPRFLDFEKGIFEDNRETYSFQKNFEQKCLANERLMNIEITSHIKKVEKDIFNQLDGFKNSLEKYLLLSKTVYPEIPLLQEIFLRTIKFLKNLIIEYNNIAEPIVFGNSQISLYWKKSERSLFSLYSKLTEDPPLVSADYEDFKLFFTGKNPVNKIKWNAKTQNHLNANALLLFFVEALDSADLIREVTNTYPTIFNGFVYDDGNEVKNLKNALNSSKNSPFGCERIQDIISELNF